MNKKTVLAAALLLGLFASSCRKDIVDDKKMPGTWIVSEYKVDGKDLMADSLEVAVVGQPDSKVRTKFNAVTLVFESDGDFTETISYGASINSNYGGYSYSYSLPTRTETGKGTWTDLDSDLSLSFARDTTGNSYMFSYSSPMNSLFVTGSQYSYETKERYNIFKLTKKEITMEGIINNKKVYIKASKQ